MNTAAPDCMRDLLLHDMRTPLAIISGYAQLLRRRAAKRKSHLGDLLRDLESIEAAAKRAERLLDQLARLPRDDDADHVDPRRTTVDLVTLAVRTSTQAQGPGRQRITVLPSVPELIGWWDSNRLEQVLTNLYGNALKYSPRECDVLVTVQHCGDCAVLRVADQGVGIPPEVQSRIFSLFFSTKPGGTGIGLAMAFRIVQLHNGWMDFSSEVARGTTFRVSLPL